MLKINLTSLTWRIKKWGKLGCGCISFNVLTAILVFCSMFVVASRPFFFILKVLLVFSLLWLLIVERSKIQFLLSRLPSYLLLIAPCIWGLMMGLWNENDGVLSELPLFGYGVITYLVIFGVLSFQNGILKAFELAVKFSSFVVISVFFCLYFFIDTSGVNYFKNLPSLYIQYPQGYLKIHSVQTTALLFLAPVMMGLYFYKKNFANGLLLALLVLLIFLSGRRSAIILIIFLALALSVYGYFLTRNGSGLLRFAAPLILSCVAFLFFVNYLETGSTRQGYISSLSDAFAMEDMSKLKNENKRSKADDSSINFCSFDFHLKAGVDPGKIGSAIRQSQAVIIVEEIKSTFFFGRGFGYGVDSCVRSENQPWRFELAYLSLIMNVGVVGFLLLVASYLTWLLQAIKLRSNRDIAYPLLLGSIFFIICSSTNPYLFSVENIWIFFIPNMIALIANREIPVEDVRNAIL